MKKFSTLFGIGLALQGFVFSGLQAQCPTQITVLSGTQSYGCGDVTVTSQGSVGNFTLCGFGPYYIGDNSIDGSYTFTFSTPVPKVSIDFVPINANTSVLGLEEISVSINGSFYHLSNAVIGPPIFCFYQTSSCYVTGAGALQALPGTVGSTKDLTITESITTLTIHDHILSGIPDGVAFSLYVCCDCETDAGDIAPGPVNICGTSDFDFPPATSVTLDNNDILQYVLYSNLINPTGSIIAISSTPNFPFNPATMQFGVTYYVMAMAGNELAGVVDINDLCLDYSNIVTVTWRPMPAVVFSIAGNPVCGGECQDINVNFSGSPPFTLTYFVQGIGQQTQVFNANSGVLQVCPPAGYTGSMSVAATSLTDAYCTCE